jgi:hypothetical protein
MEYAVVCLGVLLLIIVAVRQMGLNTSSSFLNTATVVSNTTEAIAGPVSDGGGNGDPK